MQCVRGLSDASALKKVQRLIGGGRVSIGSLSESVRVFDPQLLEPIDTCDFFVRRLFRMELHWNC